MSTSVSHSVLDDDDPALGVKRWLISCDESGLHGARYYAFGTLWMAWQRRGDFRIGSKIRSAHPEHLRSEFKWVNVNRQTLATYRDMLVQLVRKITSVPSFPEHTLLNINLPGIPASEVRGIQVTKLGSRYFSDSLTRMKDPWGREIFWIGGGTITWTGTENADHISVANGYVSVTPLHMDLTNYSLLETVKGWSLE